MLCYFESKLIWPLNDHMSKWFFLIILQKTTNCVTLPKNIHSTIPEISNLSNHNCLEPDEKKTLALSASCIWQKNSPDNRESWESFHKSVTHTARFREKVERKSLRWQQCLAGGSRGTEGIWLLSVLWAQLWGSVLMGGYIPTSTHLLLGLAAR